MSWLTESDLRDGLPDRQEVMTAPGGAQLSLLFSVILLSHGPLFDLTAGQGEPGSISSHLIPPDIGEGCGVETSIPLPNRPLHSVVFTEFQGPQF